MEPDAPHIPVMLAEVLAALDVQAGDHVIDGTFGAGGYSRAILAQGARVTGFDRDPHAVRDAGSMIEEFGGRLALIEAPFSTMADHFDAGTVDAVVLDIGVSSMQLDQAERGFSFRFDGPLDMRMAQNGVSAADVVNHASVSDLTRIIGILGEEKQASRVARAIVAARDAMPMHTTGDLVKVIERAIPRRATDKIHPATRSFQGLRIFVNDELRELARALFAAETLLRDGGRLVVVTFHSLEDRIVKKFIQDRSSNPAQSRHLPAAHDVSLTFDVPGKAMIAASEAEADGNPRARSAKLRAATRAAAAPRGEDFSIFGLPNLPWPNTAGGTKTSIGGRAR